MTSFGPAFMTPSSSGRKNKTLFATLVALGCILGVGASALFALYWGNAHWRKILVPYFGTDDGSLIWTIMTCSVAAQGLLVLLAWLTSFDTHAARRQRLGMILITAPGGLLVGATATAGLYAGGHLPPPGPFSTQGLVIQAAGLLLLPLLWIGLEGAIVLYLSGALKKADREQNSAKAFSLSRLLLLFSPGRHDTLKTVALEQFRRGERDDAVAADLQFFYDHGDASEDIVEALCRLSAERRDAASYLTYLTRLHELRPDDADLVDSLIAENIAQGNAAVALRLLEARGVGEDINDLARHATLLVETNDPDRAVDIARKIGELEGIPHKRSGEILRDVVRKRPRLFTALNVLGEQALASRNLERAIRYLSSSLALEPKQPRIKRHLIDIYREVKLTDPLEPLLAEALESAPGAEVPPLAVEYAGVLSANGKDEAARKVLVEYLKKFPKSFLLNDRLADLCCHAGRWEEANEFNVAATELAREEAEKARCRARTVRIAKSLQSAQLQQLEQDIEKSPDNTDLALELIRRLVAGGQTERAVGQADRLAHSNAQALPRVRALFAEFAKQHDSPFMIVSYLADLHLKAGDCDAAIQLADLLRERSLTPDAVELDLCERILRRVPNHLTALRRSGDLHRRNRESGDMVHCYILYLAHGGEPTKEIDRALFDAYSELQDYPNAKKPGRRLVDGDPTDSGVAITLAKLALAAKAYDDVKEWAEIAHTRAPSNTDALHLLRKVETVRSEEAINTLQALVDQGKAGPGEIEQMADHLRRVGERDKAIPLYQKAARDPERAVRSKVKLAVCLAEKGLFDLAEETIHTLAVPPDTEETPMLLDLLYILGGHFEAERLVEKAGRIYKMIFLVDAGYRDVVKKIEKFH